MKNTTHQHLKQKLSVPIDKDGKIHSALMVDKSTKFSWERNGSVVECLTRDQEAEGSSLNGVTALWSLSKTYLS